MAISQWDISSRPQFEQKAGRVLYLYQGICQGIPLKPKEFVLSADEKTSIQVRHRMHASLPPKPGECMKVEHEYERRGSLTYLAVLDVYRSKIFGRCEANSGIASFDRLVGRVMQQEPYRSAKRVFWIVDNGSSHRGQPSIDRMQGKWPKIVMVHLPVHASWLNQIEIYFSILQRKVLTPDYFSSLEMLTETILNFQQRYIKVAKPFEWKYTKADLSTILAKLAEDATLFSHAA